MKKHFLLAGFAALMLVACNNKPASELTLSGLDPVKFQTEVNNAKTALYTLKNKAGMEVCITNFGGRIVSVMVPDKNGKMQDVVLGFDSIADYINVPATSVLLSDAMQTVSTKDVSHWTATRSNCRKTISATACTEARKVGNTKFMKLI
mgnify:CR=1 FL=1